MGRHEKERGGLLADVGRELIHATNLNSDGRYRSRALHNLMDHAEMAKDYALWREIGKVVVEAFSRDDLTPQVSDHFVKKCPGRVFEIFGSSGPGRRFHFWAKRAEHIGAFKQSVKTN